MKSKNLINALSVMIPVAILFYIYMLLTPFYHDDYSYMYSFYDGTKLNTASDVLESVYWHYFTMNGRVVVHFFGHFFLYFGKPVFNVINTLGFLLLGVLMYAIAYGSLKKIKILPLSFTYISLFLFAPAFGESFLWLIGASNYMWGIILVLLFLLPYRLHAEKQQMPLLKDIPAAVGMLLLGFVAGATNENNSVALIVMLVLFLVYRILKFKKVLLWMIGGFAGSIAGCLFMMLAPAQLTRLDRSNGFANIFSYTFIREFAVSAFSLIREFGTLFIIIAALLSVYIMQYKKEKSEQKTGFLCAARELFLKNFELIMYFAGFLVSYFSLTVLLYFPKRTWSGPLVFLVIFALLIYKSVCEKNAEFELRLPKVIFGFTFAAVAVSVYFHNLFLLRDVYRAYNEREAMVATQIEEGKTVIEIPSIYSDSKYSCFESVGDLNEDPSGFPNAHIARYYGVKKVIKLKTEK